MKIIFVAVLLSLLCGITSWKLSSTLRKVASALLVSSSLSSFSQTVIAADTYKDFNNDRYHTSFKYPALWEERVGKLSGDRSLTAFVDSSDTDTSVSVAFSPIAADYSHINSFGGKETLRQYLLPIGEDVTTDIIDEHISGESYFLEYLVSIPNKPSRHIQSVFSLRPQESVVGLTIQTKQESYDSNKEYFKNILSSFHVDL